MDSSAGNSPVDGAATNKRKRVSRACDACFSKKDRCDGAKPLCKVCKSIGRSCTYNRPERKRGPSQGVRQRLEAQVESLESMLGYMIDTHPQLCSDVIRNLRLEDAEGAILKSLPSSSSISTPSPSSSSIQTSISIYPHYSKQDARDRWRVSSFARAVAPSLGLHLACGEEEEEVYGMDSMRNRIEEARMARVRLRGGVTDTSPTASSSSQPHHHHRPAPVNYAVPIPPSATPTIQMLYPQQPAPPYPHYPPQAHFAKERSYPDHPPMPSKSPYPPVFSTEQAAHHTISYHNQPAYTRPPDTYPTAASIVSPIEPYGSYPTPSFEGETDALAYALGLTYSSSPQSSQSMGRHMGSSIHSSAWMGPPGSFSDSAGDMMRTIDQHMKASSGGGAGLADDNDEQDPTLLDFFADNDMQPDHHQLSVLHQLGLQGSTDLPTPKPVEHSDRGNNPSSSVHEDAANGSRSSQHSTNHWLQPIRGIN